LSWFLGRMAWEWKVGAGLECVVTSAWGGEDMKFCPARFMEKRLHVKKSVPLHSYKEFLAKKFRGFGIE